MTTRSGRSYSKSEKTMEEVQTTMAQLLQALMEDRRVREQSLAEDREKTRAGTPGGASPI